MKRGFFVFKFNDVEVICGNLFVGMWKSIMCLLDLVNDIILMLEYSYFE